MTDSCWTHLSTVLKLCKWQLTQTLIAMCVGSLCLFRSHVQQDLTDLFVRQNASSESVPIKVLPMKGVAETWHMPRYCKGEGTGACSCSEHMFLVIVVRIVKKKWNSVTLFKQTVLCCLFLLFFLNHSLNFTQHILISKQLNTLIVIISQNNCVTIRRNNMTIASVLWLLFG